MLKILGTNDAVNTCDCCGNTNLKHTVIVDVDGEIMHYGSVCATRHTGLTSKQINKLVKEHDDGVILQAKTLFEKSAEYIAEQNAIRKANRDNLKPGKEFYNYVKPFEEQASIVKNQIAKQFNVEVYKF